MGESAQLREDVRELLSMIGRVVETDGDRLLLKACADVLRERLDRLAEVEDGAT